MESGEEGSGSRCRSNLRAEPGIEGKGINKCSDNFLIGELTGPLSAPIHATSSNLCLDPIHGLPLFLITQYLSFHPFLLKP